MISTRRALISMWTMMFTGKADDVSELRVQIELLRKDLAKLEEKVKSSEDNIATLSKVDPPVGTVLAFAGAWKPKKEDGTVWTETELGWMLCDGRALNSESEKNRFLALFQVLGQAHGNGSLDEARRPIKGCNFNLPDYRNLFLRGVDDRTPITTVPTGQSNRYSALSVARFASEPARWEVKGGVGSYQADSTRLPRFQDFLMDKKGVHSHESNFETTATRLASNGQNTNTVANSDITSPHRTKDDGGHDHFIKQGGDFESRPINSAVNYIIKFKAP